MRKSLLGLATGLIALVGLTSTANAGSTVDLIWASTGTSFLPSIATSSSTTLMMVVTNDAFSVKAAISLDYNGLLGPYSLVGFTNNPNESSGVLPLQKDPTNNIDGKIDTFTAGALPPYVGSGLAAGQSYILGTATFHRDGPGLITTGAFAFFGNNAGIDAGGVAVPESQITLGSTLHPIPEPETVLMLGLGLVGLTLTCRREKNTR